MIQQVWVECWTALNNNVIIVNEAIAQLQLVCLDANTIDAFIDRWRSQTILQMILDDHDNVDPILQDNIEHMLLTTPTDFDDYT